MAKFTGTDGKKYSFALKKREIKYLHQLLQDAKSNDIQIELSEILEKVMKAYKIKSSRSVHYD